MSINSIQLTRAEVRRYWSQYLGEEWRIRRGNPIRVPDSYRPGAEVGHLTIKVSLPGPDGCMHCRCRCGRKARVSPAGARLREQLGVGCGRLDCTALPLSQAIRLWPETSLEFQLRVLLTFYPDQVVTLFGGSEGLDDEGQPKEMMIFLHHWMVAVERLVSYPDWRIWIDRVDPAFPYVPGNLKAVSRPPAVYLTALDTQGVTVPYSANEVARLSGADPWEVLTETLMKTGQIDLFEKFEPTVNWSV